MTIEDYCSVSGVSFDFINNRYSYKPGDKVDGIEHVLGQVVWICDYHNGKNPLAKPIRNLPPTQAVICSMDDATFPNNLHFCPVPFFFKKVKNGKITDEEICPFDRTSKATFVQIFDYELDCNIGYKYLLSQAKCEVEELINKCEKKINSVDNLLKNKKKSPLV